MFINARKCLMALSLFPMVALADPNSIIHRFEDKQKQALQHHHIMSAGHNLKVGEAYLKANKKRKGVKTLKSGLQYKIIRIGHGPKPTLSDHVTVNYIGQLLSGKVFDSSYAHGKPATFPVSGVIQGWQQILPMMPEGSTWMVYVPSNLAYGEKGAGDMIPPNATLIFKIELLSIHHG